MVTPLDNRAGVTMCVDRMTHQMTKEMGPGHQLALKCSHFTDHRIATGPDLNPQHTGGDGWEVDLWKVEFMGHSTLDQNIHVVAEQTVTSGIWHWLYPRPRALQGSIPHQLGVLPISLSPVPFWGGGLPRPPVKMAPTPELPIPPPHLLTRCLPPLGGELQEGGDPLPVVCTDDKSSTQNDPGAPQTLRKYLPSPYISP